jgi:hypothetical protein
MIEPGVMRSGGLLTLENSLTTVLQRYGASHLKMFSNSLFNTMAMVPESMDLFYAVIGGRIQDFDAMVDALRIVPGVNSAYVTPPAETAGMTDGNGVTLLRRQGSRTPSFTGRQGIFSPASVGGMSKSRYVGRISMFTDQL